MASRRKEYCADLKTYMLISSLHIHACMVSAEQNVGGIGLLWSNMVGGYLSLYMFAKFISSHEV